MMEAAKKNTTPPWTMDVIEKVLKTSLVILLALQMRFFTQVLLGMGRSEDKNSKANDRDKM